MTTSVIFSSFLSIFRISYGYRLHHQQPIFSMDDVFPGVHTPFYQ
jgi:hypothetical protein